MFQHSVAGAYVRGAKSWLLFMSDQILAERFEDHAFHVGRRNAGDRAYGCRLGLTVEVGQGDIIAIAEASLGRMCRHHAVAGIVKQQAGQQMIARADSDQAEPYPAASK
jgi:hypothetical protein